MTRSIVQPDPRLDLVFERIVDVPQELVWKAWTTPEHLKTLVYPSPWKTIDCEIDLRPGGLFRTVMRSPEGQEFPNGLLSGDRHEREACLDQCIIAGLPARSSTCRCAYLRHLSVHGTSDV